MGRMKRSGKGPGWAGVVAPALVMLACNGGGGESDSGSGTLATTTGSTATTTGVTDGGSGSETGGAIGSCSPDAPVDLEVSGEITSDTTWSGTVRVTANIDVYEGAVLTILPGTAVVFAVDTDLEIGWNSQAATIRAEGTAAAPIVLCGANPQAGGWRGVSVRPNATSDSVMKFVTIRHAGGGQPALALERGITISDLTIEASGDDGVEAIDFAADSANLTVTGATGVPAALTGAGAVTRFPLGGSLTGNGDDVVELRFDKIIADTTFRPPGVPYRQTQHVDVYEAAEVVFAAGVAYRFGVDTDLEIGWNDQAATLTVEGTAEAPVVFSGDVAEPGFWRGITIHSNVTTNSRISHAEVRDGGGGSAPVLTIESPISLEHLTLAGNQIGASVARQGLAATSTDLNITGTKGRPMVIEPTAWTTVPTGGSYAGNDDDRIEVSGVDLHGVTGTIRAVGVPYFVSTSIDVYEDSSLTFEAGVEVEMGPDTDLEFGWNNQATEVIAEGTAESPIVFRGVDPVAGWWRGLKINSNVLSSSKLIHVHVLHAGQSGGGNLEVHRSLTVTGSHFEASAGYGILREMGDATDYVTPNTFASNALGDVGTF